MPVINTELHNVDNPRQEWESLADSLEAGVVATTARRFLLDDETLAQAPAADGGLEWIAVRNGKARRIGRVKHAPRKRANLSVTCARLPEETEREALIKVITEELKSEFRDQIYVSVAEATAFAMGRLADSEIPDPERLQIAAEAEQRFAADSRLV